MRQLFIFTAGNPAARAHIQDSITNPVPAKLLDECLSEDQARMLKSLLPDPQGFYAWGAVPGVQNIPRWQAMREGDVVLTVYDNCYHFVSTVLAKLHSPKLAREIWQEDDDGNTWEYMYLLTRPESVNLHVSAEPVSSLLNKSYRGFAKISDEKVQHIFHTYGGLQQFIAREFNKIIPDSAGKNVLKSIEIRVEDEPFTPSNDVDAREKVLREIVRRRGQPQFRRQLLKAYQGRCAVTGCDVESVLEAAHIMPYLGDHTNHITNGLLLRADIHTLFDLGELRVDSAGRIHVADELLSGFYGDLHGRYISLPIDEKKRPNPNALQLKFQQGI